MKSLLLKIQFLSFLLLFFATANANTVTFSGDTTGQPTWQRTNSDCTTLSATGNGVNFQEQVFSISSDAACTLTLEGVTHPDTYLSLYTVPFDSNTPPTNCVAADDDSSPTSGLDSRISTALTAGQSYVFVASAFSVGQFGTFDATIECQGSTVTLQAASTPSSVPTLSTWMLLILMLTLGMVGFYTRKPSK